MTPIQLVGGQLQAYNQHLEHFAKFFRIRLLFLMVAIERFCLKGWQHLERYENAFPNEELHCRLVHRIGKRIL